MNRPCKELKRIARENLTHHYSIPMGALLATWIIPLAIELPFSMIQGEHPTLMQSILYYAAEFLIGLISYVLSAGIAWIHLNLARKKPCTLSMVFYGFKERPDRFLLAGFSGILTVLIGMIPFFIGLAVSYTVEKRYSYILLGISSVISLILVILFMLNISLTLYLVIDHPEPGVWQCLKNSIHIMRGHKKRLLYVWLSFLGLQLLNLLSFGIGALWTGPYQSQTLANFYLDTTGQLPSPAQAAPGSPQYRSFHEYL